MVNIDLSTHDKVENTIYGVPMTGQRVVLEGAKDIYTWDIQQGDSLWTHRSDYVSYEANGYTIYKMPKEDLSIPEFKLVYDPFENDDILVKITKRIKPGEQIDNQEIQYRLYNSYGQYEDYYDTTREEVINYIYDEFLGGEYYGVNIAPRDTDFETETISSVAIKEYKNADKGYTYYFYNNSYMTDDRIDERINEMKEILKSHTSCDDLYIRGYGTSAFGRGINDSNLNKKVALVKNFDELVSGIKNGSLDNNNIFILWGSESEVKQILYTFKLHDGSGVITNEGVADDGSLSYNGLTKVEDLVAPTIIENPGCIFKGTYGGKTFDQIKSDFSSWQKTKLESWNNKIVTAGFDYTSFTFDFSRASYLTTSSTKSFNANVKDTIVVPTINATNHYVFDKWTDADGNEIDVNEVIASYKNDPTESKTVYATEKLLPKLLFNVDAVTDDTGTYADPATYYKDDITSSTIYSEYPTGIIPKVEGNEDFTFIGWTDDLTTKNIITNFEDLVENWVLNIDNDLEVYAVMQGKPMVHYIIDHNKGSVDPSAKLSYIYDKGNELIYNGRSNITRKQGYELINGL